MNTQLVQEYIEFAIENGFKFFNSFYWVENVSKDGGKVLLESDTTIARDINTVELITSKDFIASIKKGINEGLFDSEDPVESTFNSLDYKSMNDITRDQAIAIRDNTLDTFIKNITNNDN